MNVEGAGALVTGGGSGLGEATSRALAARGAIVGVVDLGRSNGAEVAAEIGGGGLFLETDVTSEGQMTAAVERALEAFGNIRVLVNCAGIGSASRTVGKDNAPFDLGLFRKTIEVNLIGTFNAIRLAAARMVDNEPDSGGERGAIVNTASVAPSRGRSVRRRTRRRKAASLV